MQIEDIFQLSNKALGENFLNRTYLKQYIDSSSKIGLIAIENNQFAGYILFDILSNQEFINEILSEKEWFSNELKNCNKVCLIKQVAVSKKHQKKGVASQLVNKVLTQTNTTKITYCLGWKKGAHVAIKNSLLKNNFTFQRTIDNYWSKDSLNKKYNCGYCGNPPCECSVDVYLNKKASISD